MTHIPDHFSSNFKINLDDKLAKNVDQASIANSLLNLIGGILLLCLGLFELYTFLLLKSPTTQSQSLLVVEIFASIIAIVGVVMMINALLSLIRYKRIKFDGKSFYISYRPSLGIRTSVSEPLENYMGVRFRIVVNNQSIISQNKYIIDLYHRDKNKIIPLYISTKSKDIRYIWEEYAKFFKLPAITLSERGMVQKDYKDLSLSIIEQNEQNKLPPIISGKAPTPKSIIVKERENYTSVRHAKIHWDKFNTAVLSFLIYCSSVIIFAGYFIYQNNIILPAYYWALSYVVILMTLYLLLKSCKRYKLYIEKDKIVIKERILGIQTSKKELSKKNIGNIELNYSPTIDKYCLTIIARNSVIIFGNRLPVNDLLWLKDFIIRKLIGN